MRLALVLPLLLALTACQRGTQNKDAVRQGVLDYLASRPNLSMGGMNVDVTDVGFAGGRATATVSFTPKSGPAGSGMSMRYTLEQRGDKWAVVGKADSGATPHGAAAGSQGTPGMANPHGGAMGGIDTEKPGGGPPPASGKK